MLFASTETINTGDIDNIWVLNFQPVPLMPSGWNKSAFKHHQADVERLRRVNASVKTVTYSSVRIHMRFACDSYIMLVMELNEEATSAAFQ